MLADRTADRNSHCSSKIPYEDNGGVIEIYDSDDFDSTDLLEHGNSSQHSAKGTRNGMYFGRENGNKSAVKAEPNYRNVENIPMGEIFNFNDEAIFGVELTTNENGESFEQKHLQGVNMGTANIDKFKDETTNASDDVVLIVFDPNDKNPGNIDANKNIKCHEKGRASPSSNEKANHSKRNGAKRFKCMHCDSRYQTKWELQSHDKVHANGKFMGIKADSNGVYRCTFCVRRFAKVGQLSMHMKSHANG